MAENDTEVLDADDAGTDVDTELDVGAIVADLVAEPAGDTEVAADAEPTGDGEGFEASQKQMDLAKQLGFDDVYVSNMTEAQAEAAEQFGVQQSRYQQRRGKETPKKDEPKDDPPASVDSSAGGTDEFTEDDLYTPEGIKKLNDFNRRLRAQEARGKQEQTSEQDRQQAEIDGVFDGLDKEIFADFQPGETFDPGSDVDERRTAVVDMAKAIQGAPGHDISTKAAIEQALKIVAPAETEKAAQKAANAGRRQRGSQRLSTPSTTTGSHKVKQATPELQAVADTMEALSPK